MQIFLSSLISGLQRNLIEQTVGDSPHILLAQENSPQSILQKGINRWLFQLLQRQKGCLHSFISAIIKKLDTFPNLKIVSPLVEGSGFITKAEVSRPVVVKGIFLIVLMVFIKLFSE